jgi:hypothetical protein
MTKLHTVKEKENVPKIWAALLHAFSEDFQKKVEKEWGNPFAEVYGFLTSRTKRQLAFIATAGKTTELLCFYISKIMRETS